MTPKLDKSCARRHREEVEAGLSRKGARGVAVKFLDPFLLSKGIATCALAPHQSLMESESHFSCPLSLQADALSKEDFPPVQRLPPPSGRSGASSSFLVWRDKLWALQLHGQGGSRVSDGCTGEMDGALSRL